MTPHPVAPGERAAFVPARCAPGLHFEDVWPVRPALERPPHGVPLFVGFGAARFTTSRRAPPALDVSSWEHFRTCVAVPDGGFLGHAVKSFFVNGGRLCAVHPVPVGSGSAGLKGAFAPRGPLEDVTGMDLVCVPDAVSVHEEPGTACVDVQAAVLAHCESMGERFALLDAAPLRGRAIVEDLEAQAGRLRSPFGALYFPWLQVEPATPARGPLCVPPCGHVAGVCARTDARAGVHKAPANERVDGVLATQWVLDAAEHRMLNDAGVNCIRNLTGRGIRVWGARTLSARSDWVYVPVARVFLALVRWLQHNLDDVVFEPHTPELWRRVERRIGEYGRDLLDSGALAGHEQTSAFYVKCDAELNPPDSRDAGRLVAEVGLATSVPAEFVVVRIIHDASGFVMTRP